MAGRVKADWVDAKQVCLLTPQSLQLDSAPVERQQTQPKQAGEGISVKERWQQSISPHSGSHSVKPVTFDPLKIY